MFRLPLGRPNSGTSCTSLSVTRAELKDGIDVYMLYVCVNVLPIFCKAIGLLLCLQYIFAGYLFPPPQIQSNYKSKPLVE
jgi:hypothetical protein